MSYIRFLFCRATIMQNYKSDPDRGKPIQDRAELTDEQARERCHTYLMEGLRLIPFKDRIRAFAAAMKELLQYEEKHRGGRIAD
jgi:hypothetical protein